jgi:DNA-binding FrmR family transcriptional regulator
VSHTRRSKKKLLDRVRRLAGQVGAVERVLEEDRECSAVLLSIAACRGALNALLAEVVEGHVREHVAARGVKPGERAEAAEELIEIVRAYLK